MPIIYIHIRSFSSKQLSCRLPVPATEQRRVGAARGRHRVRAGEVRRRLVRRHIAAQRFLRHLPRQLCGADLETGHVRFADTKLNILKNPKILAATLGG